MKLVPGRYLAAVTVDEHLGECRRRALAEPKGLFTGDAEVAQALTRGEEEGGYKGALGRVP